MNTKKVEPNNDQVIFTCPTIRHLQRLSEQIVELKFLLTKSQSEKAAMLDNADLMLEYHISRTTAQVWRAHGLGYFKVEGKLFYERNDIDTFLKKYKYKGF